MKEKTLPNHTTKTEHKLKYVYHCEKCGIYFNFPKISCPDAGLAFETGILGLRKNKPIHFCPKCHSVNIKKKYNKLGEKTNMSKPNNNNKETKKELFSTFGEFDSAEELNQAAAGQLAEGDIEALEALAKENGIEKEDVDEYIKGDTDELCDPLSAAMGKLKIEREQENNMLIDDIADYLLANADDETMAHAIRKKGKRTTKAAELVAAEAKKNKITVPGMGSCNYCGPMKGFQIIRGYYMGG